MQVEGRNNKLTDFRDIAWERRIRDRIRFLCGPPKVKRYTIQDIFKNVCNNKK